MVGHVPRPAPPHLPRVSIVGTHGGEGVLPGAHTASAISFPPPTTPHTPSPHPHPQHRAHIFTHPVVGQGGSGGQVQRGAWAVAPAGTPPPPSQYPVFPPPHPVCALPLPALVGCSLTLWITTMSWEWGWRWVGIPLAAGGLTVRTNGGGGPGAQTSGHQAQNHRCVGQWVRVPHTAPASRGVRAITVVHSLAFFWWSGSTRTSVLWQGVGVGEPSSRTPTPHRFRRVPRL
jgi:hypothetical protein